MAPWAKVLPKQEDYVPFLRPNLKKKPYAKYKCLRPQHSHRKRRQRHENPQELPGQLAWHVKWENNPETLPPTRWKTRTISTRPISTHAPCTPQVHLCSLS